MKCLPVLLALVLVACRADRDRATLDVPRGTERSGDTTATGSTQPASTPSQTAPAAPSGTTPHREATNRDAHGDHDVERYVARLASPERIAELRVDEVVARLAPAADAIIGDLGCGPGIFAIPFARAASEGFVLASDIEPGQLDALRTELAAQGVHNVVPVLSSADDPHFLPGRMDLVFVGDTYHHLRDRVAYFRRLQGSLAPGGRLAILEYKPGKLPVGPAEDHKLPAGLRAAELIEAGYSLVERFTTHTYHDFEVWRVVQPWEK